MGMAQAGFRASQTAWASAASTVYTPPTGISSKRTDGLRLFRQELVSQVPQVGYRETACGEDVDGVSSPEGATLAVMEGFYGADGKRAGAVKGDGFRLLHGVVVKMAVAAQNFVDLEIGFLVHGDPVV